MADYIRPTPRNPILGLLADALTGGVDWMRDPRRAQQMQGLGGLLAETGIPATVERLSYGEPLTKGKGMTTRLRPEAEAALLTLSPVPQATSRAAMAAGRAGERMAERVVPQVMERGGRGAGLLEALSARTVSPLTVYHGSPAKFEKFDASKIGTGEGAQAYGYGHYVAESPGVAESYRKALSDNVFTIGSKNISGPTSRYGQPAQNPARARLSAPEKMATYALDSAIKSGRSDPSADAIKHLTKYGKGNPDAASAIEVVRQWAQQGGKVEAGNLYTIDLPDSAIARMLDWDKKFSEQPENVQRGILKYWSENPGLKYYGRPEQMTGEGIYGSIKAASLGPEGGARINLNPANQAAAMDLRYQGIPGIRYLDQGSRGAGQGTSNFVVFPGEEGLLRILKRNEDPLGLFAP